ncbi:hypothetical protein SRHO_G00320580 [Serrasalmus rhombeus]
MMDDGVILANRLTGLPQEGGEKPVDDFHNQVSGGAEAAWSGAPHSASHGGLEGSGLKSVITLTGPIGVILKEHNRG